VNNRSSLEKKQIIQQRSGSIKQSWRKIGYCDHALDYYATNRDVLSPRWLAPVGSKTKG